jgi:hypothetical protein
VFNSRTPRQHRTGKTTDIFEAPVRQKVRRLPTPGRTWQWRYRDRTGIGVCWMVAWEMNETSDASMTRQLVPNQYVTKHLLLCSTQEYVAYRFAVLWTANSQRGYSKNSHTKQIAAVLNDKLFTGYEGLINERLVNNIVLGRSWGSCREKLREVTCADPRVLKLSRMWRRLESFYLDDAPFGKRNPEFSAWRVCETHSWNGSADRGKYIFFSEWNPQFLEV